VPRVHASATRRPPAVCGLSPGAIPLFACRRLLGYRHRRPLCILRTSSDPSHRAAQSRPPKRAVAQARHLHHSVSGRPTSSRQINVSYVAYSISAGSSLSPAELTTRPILPDIARFAATTGGPCTRGTINANLGARLTTRPSPGDRGHRRPRDRAAYSPPKPPFSLTLGVARAGSSFSGHCLTQSALSCTTVEPCRL